MFRAIVWAILFVELWIPLIIWLFSLAWEDHTVGCIIFWLVILAVILILG